MALAAILVGTVVDAEHWFGGNPLVIAVSSLAAAIVAFNWCELWSERHEQ